MKLKSQIKTDSLEFAADNEPTTSSRTNLNDLLKRIKDQERNDKRTNLIIFSSAISVFAIIILILSL